MTAEQRGTPGVGDYERWWGATADDDRVWSPGGDPGDLRFTPTGEPRHEEPLPPVVPVAPAGGGGRPATRVVAIAVAVAVLSVFVGAQIGTHFRRHAAVRPQFGAPPLTPRTSIPPTTVTPGAPTTVTPAAPTPFFPNPNPNPPAANRPVANTPGVVDITGRLAFGAGADAGTGMLLNDTGAVLTNDHVIAGTSSITVQVNGAGPTYEATVVGNDPTHDVAVLQLKAATGLTPIALGDSSAVKVGDPVTAVGNALGRNGPPTMATGTVRALNQTIDVDDPAKPDGEHLTGLIATDAPLQPGDSGGPLLNSQGQAIGMDTAGSLSRRGGAGREGYAIAMNDALAIAHQIQAGQASATIRIGPPAFLGVRMADPASGAPGTPATSGAVVSGVEPGTPAEKAQLGSGDTIVVFDGHPVDSPSTLKSAILAHKPGDTVALSWTTADGQHRDGTVQLASGPPE